MRRPNIIIPDNFDYVRFIIKVIPDMDSDCLLWASFLGTGGYGGFNIKALDGNWKSFQAHRVAFQIAGNKLDRELVLDHICKKRNCVNPNHLRQVTPKQNVLFNSDSFVAYNRFKTHCPQGHEYSKDNTRLSKTRARYCLACKRIKIASFRARNK